MTTHTTQTTDTSSMQKPQIIFMSLKDAEAAYDRYDDKLKKLWAIVVYKNGYAAITLRSELKNINLRKD